MRAKIIADLLTVSRVAIALTILWLGNAGGRDALPAATVALICAWATDLLDGAVARMDRSGKQTWVGERDLEADMSVSLGVLAYLTLAGFVPVWGGAVYLIVSLVLLWRFGLSIMGMAVQAPPYCVMLLVALWHAPLQGLIAVSYLVLAVIVTWPRFPLETVPRFLTGMRNLSSSTSEETKS